MKVLLVDQIAKVTYKYTFSLAKALQELGIDIEVAMDFKQEKENTNFKRFNLFNTAEKNVSKFSKLKNYIQSFNKIFSLIENYKYDVIHLQWIIFSPVDLMIVKKLKRKNIKVVMTVHDILPFNQKFYDYKCYKRTYQLVDEIIVQTDANKDRFKKEFPKNKHEIAVIPHGHFLDYSKVVTKEKARKALGLSDNEFIYLFFGQIKKVKGVDVLLTAYGQLLKERPELKNRVKLVLAGKEWKADYDDYKKIILEYGLEPFIRQDIKFIPDEEIDNYYGSADVCVLPYRDVYQSGVLQLTYAHEKPAIVTDIPAFKEIVNVNNGFICKVNDAESLKNQMYEAYLRKDELHILGEVGRKYIEKRYNWGDIAGGVSKIYSIGACSND